MKNELIKAKEFRKLIIINYFMKQLFNLHQTSIISYNFEFYIVSSCFYYGPNREIT